MNQNLFAIILAGGSGTRFWPESRQLKPKQLCKIGDSDLTMIETTLKRLDGFIPPEQRMIVTHHEQIDATRAIVKGQAKYWIAEPEAKNTASALAVANQLIVNLQNLGIVSGDAIVVSLHADAVIKDVPGFQHTLVSAGRSAAEGRLTLIGIKPEYPETGYGYIEPGKPLADAFEVSSFKEKPDLNTATDYIGRGFLWNSGMFVWRPETFSEELQNHMPDLSKSVTELFSEDSIELNDQELARMYEGLQKVSVDEGILEKSRALAVVGADIGWQDVGSWDALDRWLDADSDGNIKLGTTVAIDTKNTTLFSDGPPIATIGLEDMIVAVSNGAILVCPKDRAQDVKKVVEALKSQDLDQHT